MINFPHLGWLFALCYPPQFLHGSGLRNSPLKSYKGFSYGVKTVWFDKLTIKLTPLHHMDVIPWMSIFNLLVNKNYFSVPVERHRFLKSHDITLHASLHWHDKCHCVKLENVIVMITWSGNATIGRNTISGQNHIIKYQLQIMTLVRLFLKENEWLLSQQEILKSTSIETGMRLFCGVL